MTKTLTLLTEEHLAMLASGLEGRWEVARDDAEDSEADYDTPVMEDIQAVLTWVEASEGPFPRRLDIEANLGSAEQEELATTCEMLTDYDDDLAADFANAITED